MTVATFKGIIGLETGPFVLCQLKTFLLKLLAGADSAEELAPDFFRRRHFTGDLVGPVMGHMTIGTGCADP